MAAVELDIPRHEATGNGGQKTRGPVERHHVKDLGVFRNQPQRSILLEDDSAVKLEKHRELPKSEAEPLIRQDTQSRPLCDYHTSITGHRDVN